MGFTVFGWTVPLKRQMEDCPRFPDFFQCFQSGAQNGHLCFTVTSGANVLTEGMLNGSHPRHADRGRQLSDI